MNATAFRTSAAAVARLIREEMGIHTDSNILRSDVVRVSKGALKGTAVVICDFEIEGRARRRMAMIAEVLRDRGFEVEVWDDGTSATVSRLADRHGFAAYAEKRGWSILEDRYEPSTSFKKGRDIVWVRWTPEGALSRAEFFRDNLTHRTFPASTPRKADVLRSWLDDPRSVQSDRD